MNWWSYVTLIVWYGSCIPNVNTDLLLSFCRRHHLSIAGPWFQRKDIHRFSWISNDWHTRKEIDHILSSCGKMVRQCRVYRSFDVDSDHFPVLATLLPSRCLTSMNTSHGQTCNLTLPPSGNEYHILNYSNTSTMYAKNETHIIILNILYSCKSIAMKFSIWYHDDLSY